MQEIGPRDPGKVQEVSWAGSPGCLSPLDPDQKRVFLNSSSPKWWKKDGQASNINWRSPGCNEWLALKFIEV